MYRLEVIDNDLMQYNGLDSPGLIHLEIDNADADELYGSIVSQSLRKGSNASLSGGERLGRLTTLSRRGSTAR